jgi:23S rRNA (uracil1939-C5)-methyltransferase
MSGDGEVVTIRSLASGGSGVGRLADGMTVFVPRTVPGDVVRLAELRRRRRHAEAQVAQIVTAGPDRVEPVCPHFTADRCGGCQWLHIAPAAQAEAKRRIVGDALRRIAKLDLPDPELVSSPHPLGYRTTVTLTVRWRGSRPVVGFHDSVTPDRVFPLEHCAIAHPDLNALWEALRGAAACLPRGDDVRLKLRRSSAGALHAVVAGGDRAWTDGAPLVAAAHARGLSVSVWWQPAAGAVRRVAGPEADPAVAAFAQVNPAVATLLYAAVVNAVQAAGRPGRLLDLYAGAGETALALAEAGWDAVLVELDARAVRRAEALAADRSVRLRCIAGRVEEHLAPLLPADVVVVNPPRTGLGAPVTERLFAQFPRRLVYVSCDPATLSRDLARLGVAASHVRDARAFDMFPQTSHVETVVVAERVGA